MLLCMSQKNFIVKIQQKIHFDTGHTFHNIVFANKTVI